MFSSLRIRLSWVLLTGILFLSGCITSTSETTRFYVLNPLDAGAGILNSIDRKTPLSLEVALLRLPRYLERPQIVTRSGKNRLELAEYHQWGGNLRKNMIRVIAKNLSLLLDTPNISIAPNRLPVPTDFRVELEVLQFERDSDGQVRLSVQWRLSHFENNAPLAVRITELVSPTVPTDLDFEQTVSEMSMLLSELSRIIGKTILAQDL
jgi:uncharacterized lipoprotein YmbA